MTEAGATGLETNREEAWTVFAGKYDRDSSPVTREGLEAVEQTLEKSRTRLGYSETVIDRARKVEVLMYLAGLCDPRVASDQTAKEQAYRDFSKGAMLLSGYRINELRIHADTELSHLDSTPIPILGAVEDIKAKGLMGWPQAEELGVIARLAAISELDGQLPPLRRPRD